jgi:hypothetical protein
MSLKNKVGWAFGVLSAFSTVVQLLEFGSNFGTWLSTITGETVNLVIQILLFLFMSLFPIYLVVNYRAGKKQKKLDPRFIHLTIHYSQRTDNPDTSNPAKPSYIVDNRTKQAYPLSSWLDPFIKQHLISYHPHDGETALKTYFKKNGIHPNEVDLLPEYLGLSFGKNGLLVKIEGEPQIVSKLRGRRLDDLEMYWLYPWYHYLLPSSMRKNPPRKRLLRKFSKKKTFNYPSHDIELVENNIISKDTKIMLPWDSLESWSNRHHYTYIDRKYSEDELMKEKSS